MENLHGTHPNHDFVNVPNNKENPQALRGFVYLPPQPGLDELGEDATIEQKRDREAAIEILSGTYVGKMTRRYSEEIGRCFPRLYPEYWKPTEEEVEIIQYEHKAAGALPLSVDSLRKRIQEYGKMSGLEQQNEYLMSDMEDHRPGKKAHASNIRGTIVVASQMKKPSLRSGLVGAIVEQVKTKTQNKSSGAPKDRPGAISQHVALGSSTSRKRTRVISSSDDEEEQHDDKGKTDSAPVAKRQASGPKVHRNTKRRSHHGRAGRATSRQHNVADPSTSEDEYGRGKLRRLAAEVSKEIDDRKAREKELSRQALESKEAFAKSLSLKGLAAFLEQEDTASVRVGRDFSATFAGRMADEEKDSDKPQGPAAAMKVFGQRQSLIEEKEKGFPVAESLAQDEGGMLSKRGRKHPTDLTYKAHKSLAISPPTIMPVVQKPGNIMSALEKPRFPCGKPLTGNRDEAGWLHPSEIRWTTGALERLKKESRDREADADKGFAAEMTRVREESNEAPHSATKWKGKAAVNARTAPAAKKGKAFVREPALTIL